MATVGQAPRCPGCLGPLPLCPTPLPNLRPPAWPCVGSRASVGSEVSTCGFRGTGSFPHACPRKASLAGPRGLL